jgi:hypothetical protein
MMGSATALSKESPREPTEATGPASARRWVERMASSWLPCPSDDQPVQLGVAAPDGQLQRIQGQIGAQRPRGRPADQQAAAASITKATYTTPDQVAS